MCDKTSESYHFLATSLSEISVEKLSISIILCYEMGYWNWLSLKKVKRVGRFEYYFKYKTKELLAVFLVEHMNLSKMVLKQ